MKHRLKGQTLVEIIVVVGVIVVLTTALVILTTYSLKNSRVSKLRSQAMKYAAEGMEYVRQKRDTGWEQFQALDGSLCIGDGGEQSASCEENVNNFFERKATFTWNETDNRMDVVVTVSWPEGETTLRSFFTRW